jgi:hypothetical protein
MTPDLVLTQAHRKYSSIVPERKFLDGRLSHLWQGTDTVRLSFGGVQLRNPVIVTDEDCLP